VSARHTVFIEGAALWARQAPGWDAWCAAVRGEPPVPAIKPNPSRLSANERRRASDSVLLAVEVAEQAVAARRRNWPASSPPRMATWP
jgi:hypothetical protein